MSSPQIKYSISQLPVWHVEYLCVCRVDAVWVDISHSGELVWEGSLRNFIMYWSSFRCTGALVCISKGRMSSWSFFNCMLAICWSQKYSTVYGGWIALCKLPWMKASTECFKCKQKKVFHTEKYTLPLPAEYILSSLFFF